MFAEDAFSFIYNNQNIHAQPQILLQPHLLSFKQHFFLASNKVQSVLTAPHNILRGGGLLEKLANKPGVWTATSKLLTFFNKWYKLNVNCDGLINKGKLPLNMRIRLKPLRQFFSKNQAR